MSGGWQRGGLRASIGTSASRGSIDRLRFFLAFFFDTMLYRSYFSGGHPGVTKTRHTTLPSPVHFSKNAPTRIPAHDAPPHATPNTLPHSHDAPVARKPSRQAVTETLSYEWGNSHSKSAMQNLPSPPPRALHFPTRCPLADSATRRHTCASAAPPPTSARRPRAGNKILQYEHGHHFDRRNHRG